MSILEKQEKKERQDLNERTIRVSGEIIKSIANYEKGLITSDNREKIVEHYDGLIKNVYAILLENNVKLNEINYIFDMIGSILSHTQQYINSTNSSYTSFIDRKIYNIDNVKDITVSQLLNKAAEYTDKK